MHDQPAVVIAGGFATSPPNYWGLRRRLLARGAARVDICQLWPPDWMLAGLVGFGPILSRTGRRIAATHRAAGRQPIIVIGHSAGGIAARLAMSGTPYRGQLAGVSEAVGCLVTLGTPHGLAALPHRHQHAGHEAAEFLEHETPGAFFAPRTAYLTVCGRIEPVPVRDPVAYVTRAVFTRMVGEQPEPAGDGIVPVVAAHLEGATQITLDGVKHGMIGGPWYGDEETLDRWWPAAVDAWRSALGVRASARVGLDQAA
jgi:PGAP1-like protein